MRVISQNGMIDVPYEMIALHCTETIIRINMVGDTGKGIVMAEYSTLDKTQKAMKLLHEEWNDYAQIGLFRFPADDEIEVE